MTERGEHLFTVDVEEYFQVHAFDGYLDRHEWPYLPSRVDVSTGILLDLLAEQDIRGTFFVLGWIADRHPDVVARIADAGHEVASHGWSHRKITELDPERFREEVRRSRDLLEQITGQQVVGYRAPSYSLVPGTEWVYEVLSEEGYQYDSSIFPIRRSGYGYPGASQVPHLVDTPSGSVLELPLATLEWAGLSLPAAGGAYFRHLPYGLASRAFRSMEDRDVPGVFYIHSWEVDEHQPRLPVSLLSRWRHYGGLDRTVPRLQRLTEEFRFTSVRERFGLGDGSGSRPSPEATNGRDTRVARNGRLAGG